jgi:COMPASS component SPP1
LKKSDNILLDSDEICLAPKRTCSVHFKWEKLRRAQIDLEKLRIWLKLEELMEQKRLHEAAMNQRGGLLSLFMHQTTLINNKQQQQQTTDYKQHDLEPSHQIEDEIKN